MPPSSDVLECETLWLWKIYILVFHLRAIISEPPAARHLKFGTETDH